MSDSSSQESFQVQMDNIAVLDIGVSTQKLTIIDMKTPKEALYHEHLYFPLTKNKDFFDEKMKYLIRSIADYQVRQFILTTTASHFFPTLEETIDFITKVIDKYVYQRNILYYSLDGGFVPLKKEKTKQERNLDKIMSSGWKALGEGISAIIGEDAIVVEFSTRTTSIIPVKNGKVLSSSMSDEDRVKNNELLFLGLLETNVSYIENQCGLDGVKYSLPWEYHCNTADIFLITNDLQEQDYICDTPDSRRKTPENAILRLSKVYSMARHEEKKTELIEKASTLKRTMLNTILELIYEQQTKYQIKTIVLTGLGTTCLYEFITKEENKQKLLASSKIIRKDIYTPSHMIGYLYSIQNKNKVHADNQ